MSLADDAVAGIKPPLMKIEVPEPKGFSPRDTYTDLIEPYVVRYGQELAANQNAVQLETGPGDALSWVDALQRAHREGRERWLTTPAPGYEGNPLRFTVPAWYDALCQEREGMSAQAFAEQMFRPYLVEIEVLRSYP